jgi:NitT/TauT family transport system ATP-binding protein
VSDPAIRLSGVGHCFGGTEVLQDLSLAIEEGSFVSILGPSGCGKSTLLRLVDGLVDPASGEVEVLGRPPAPGPDMGVVFQSFRLLPWRTAAANVGFPLRVAGVARAEREERVNAALDLVGLKKAAHLYPAQLSGGMQQRVALARALVGEPRILLMDEPFASVDAQTRELMQAELLRIVARRRMTVLFVTHSIDEAVTVGDRVLLLGGRPGRLIEDVAVPIERPRDPVELRAAPDFVRLTTHLRRRMRDLVVGDKASEFFGRA